MIDHANVTARRALAVIAARGGSKRLPGKNLRQLAGQPSIAYAIAAAYDSGLFDQVVVSTDSEPIAEMARKFGAHVPFLRALELADDLTPVSAVTLDMLQRLDPHGCCYHDVAQLMGNCPLITAASVRDSYRQFVETGSTAQVSVTRFHGQNPWWAMTRDASSQLSWLFANRRSARSQDLPPLFCPTGAIWWITAATLRVEKTFHTYRCTGWEIPWHEAVDIDDEEDWHMAELLMEARQGTYQGASGRKPKAAEEMMKSK
jgi:N-acylneuraminate cytidylyltransferase